MRFNKIGLIAISLTSVFFMPSCKQAARINYEQAKAWVKKNCGKEEHNPTSADRYFDFSKTFGTKAREMVKEKVEAKYSIELDKNLICRKHLTDSEDLRPQYNNLTLHLLEIVSKKGDALFNILNNKLTVTTETDIDLISGASGKVYRSYQYNIKGALLLDKRDYYYIKSELFGKDPAAVIGCDEVTYSYK